MISVWHDIPLYVRDDTEKCTGHLNFVCEIPRCSRKKFEIATNEVGNPIKQDTKKGLLREFKKVKIIGARTGLLDCDCLFAAAVYCSWLQKEKRFVCVGREVRNGAQVYCYILYTCVCIIFTKQEVSPTALVRLRFVSRQLWCVVLLCCFFRSI